ncbi:MAG: glycosyltransferase family 39 protein [Gammaproteobacteria bacterium]|jgi:4-amino-4-deoxy-L-arabinose transferase-like glycosyltransferase
MNARLVSWSALLLLWLIATLAGLSTRPLIPLDETRYAAVAWEMWARGEFLVPYLNGVPYSHKPPLFFWLIHAGWWLFGVSEWWVRLVTPLLTLLLLVSTSRLAQRLWPDDRLVAGLAPWVLFSCVFLTGFFTWVQMDVLLTLCTVLAVLGIVRATRQPGSGWLLSGIAIGLGVLAKGPVILLHVLPAALLAPLWKTARPAHGWTAWYLGALAAVATGTLLALAWALPAAAAGGAAYRAAILWGQTAERIVTSFAHAHPVWWYLPWLVLLLAPWGLLPWFWSGLRRVWSRPDAGLRLCAVWSVTVFLLLSLVSGKQVKYLLPALPAFALLVARVLSRLPARPVVQRPWLPAAGLAGLGIAFMILPSVLDQAPWLNEVHPGWGALLLGVAMVWLSLPPAEPARYPPRMALLSVVAVAIAETGVVRIGAPAYDLQQASRFIATARAAGHPVVILESYHGQFGFYGRLTEPVRQLARGQALDWAREHPDGYLVSTGSGLPDAQDDAVFAQPYQSGYLAIHAGHQVMENPGVLP